MAKKPVEKKPAVKKEKKARDVFIARAPIRRLMKTEGATLCSEKAVTLLISKLTDLAQKVTKSAIKNVKAESRKRITAADITEAKKDVK